MTRLRIVLLVIGWLGGGIASLLPGAELSIADYRQDLLSLDAALARHDHGIVVQDAQQLSQSRIVYGPERLEVDPALVTALDHPAVGRARHLIAVQLAQLPTSQGTTTDGPQPDGQALAGIAAVQRLASVARDGDLGSMPLHRPTLPHQIRHVLRAILRGIGHVLRAIWHWLRSWLGGSEDDGTGHGTSHMTILVVLVCVVIAIGFVILALFNRNQGEDLRAGPAQQPTAARDADPRSRASDEWRRYGDRLAAEGRWREAMRAWYHAVLVQCWTNGTIRHRVGWTNWEYAAHLPANWSQRAAFVDLTARFDRHWYGTLGGPDDAEAFKALALAIAAQQAAG